MNGSQQQDAARERITAAGIKGPDGCVGAGVKFERTRRITGYLVGTLDKFNDAKRAEERDRVAHGAGAIRRGHGCGAAETV